MTVRACTRLRVECQGAPLEAAWVNLGPMRNRLSLSRSLLICESEINTNASFPDARSHSKLFFQLNYLYAKHAEALVRIGEKWATRQAGQHICAMLSRSLALL